MARLPNISKYCTVWRSSAAASSKVCRKLVPSMASCSMPSTLVGSGKPMASNTVGAMSMQWVNWSRTCASGRIRVGQATTIGSRAPPRWLAICLPHWNGVLLACAHAEAKCGAV